MVKLDRDQSEEMKAVKEELKELKHEYSVITANLEKVNEKLNGLINELRLVEGDLEKKRPKDCTSLFQKIILRLIMEEKKGVSMNSRNCL